MSINNRQRRRAKKHKRQRDRRDAAQRDQTRQRDQPARGASSDQRPEQPDPRTHGRDCFGEANPSPGPRWPGGRRSVPGDEVVRATVLAAAEAFQLGPGPAYQSRLEAVRVLDARAGRPSVDRALAWWVERGLDKAWTSGWQPADVLRMLRRRLSPAHADAVASSVAESGARRPEAATDQRWAGQVEAIRRDLGSRSPRPLGHHLALAVEAVSVLLRLPPLPRLGATTRGPANGRTRAGGDGSGAMLERVRALLAKAESTTFPEEAEALSAKAQELMARHAIDEAVLDAGRTGGPGGVVGWRIGVDDPYASAKSLLLDRIASANRCSAVWCKNIGLSTVFGVPSDLEMVELLFTSLLVQGTDAMLHSGSSIDRSGRSRTRSFRQSFLVAYAERIGERLSATAAQVVAEGAERYGDGLLPMLASREEAVEKEVQTVFPTLVTKGTAVSNYSGYVAGRAAAEMASLAVGGEVTASPMEAGDEAIRG